MMVDAHDDRTVVRLGVGLGAGTRLNGIYEIERLIAVGGMGEVYKGRAIETGDAVAIKTIRPDLARNESALALFRREAAALHNLHHEAIVRYYVFTVDPVLGAPYLAMEYVDGQPLAEVLKAGPLEYDAVRILQRRLAGGLQAAHDLGIIHRDVSPDNVILPAGNMARAKIIDFGIARSTILGDATVIGGGFAGKYSYVSPEQLGLFGGDVGPASDIYSLGLVLAQALTGRPLDMGGSQAEVVEKRRRVPDLSAIDSRVRPLLEHMLQPQPADRIGSMAEVATWQPRDRAAGRKTLPLALGGLAAAAALAGVAFFLAPPLLGPSPSNPQPRPAAEVPQLAGTSGAGSAADLPDPAPFKPPGSDPRPDDPPPVPAQDPGPQPNRQTAQANVPVVLPPPDPPQPAALPAADRLARYVREYAGGDCFFVTPVSLTPTSAALEGFGSSTAAFEAFDKAFLRANGFEAQISVRPVADAQCPAVAFLRQIGVDPARAPKLRLDAYNLRQTEPLSGTVETTAGRHVDVILVSDDGYVYNLADYMKRENGAAKFSLRLKGISGQRPKPQLVLAIASPQPLSLLSSGKPIAADALFPLIADEARTQGMTLDLAVKYFRLEG